MSSSRLNTQTPDLTDANCTVQDLKEIFAEHLRNADQLKRPDGIATGLQALDSFLFWKGLPKGALSLFHGALGSGSTSLWIEAAAGIVRDGRWVAWIDGDVPLSPLALHHKGLNLERLMAIETPPDERKLFWLLQELMASSLFELIGCDLGVKRLKEHQLRKLQAQAREAHVALTFLSRRSPPQGSAAAPYALIIGFEKRRVAISRALHRPTPHNFPRSVHYARFTHHTGDRIGLGADLTPLDDHPKREPRPLSATASESLARI